MNKLVLAHILSQEKCYLDSKEKRRLTTPPFDDISISITLLKQTQVSRLASVLIAHSK